LSSYIKQQNFSKDIQFHKINGSSLIDLVEQGIFLTKPNICEKMIKKELDEVISKNKINVITLSSTHLPFLKPHLINEFKGVHFLDRAENLILKLKDRISDDKTKNTFQIFTSSSSKNFEMNLKKLGIKNKVTINFKLWKFFQSVKII